MSNPPRARRSALIDNARALLISLVVLGHLLELCLRDVKPYHWLYVLIYLFHMPAFAWLSGRISRPDTFTATGLRSIAKLVAVYAVFQVAYSLADPRGPFALKQVLLVPDWVLWWFVSLVTWRLALPLFAWYRKPLLALSLALAAAVGAGYVINDGSILSVSRTLTFFPFFLAGHFAGALGWRMQRSIATRLASVSVFAVVSGLLLAGRLPIGVRWLWARETFDQLHVGGWEAGATRLGVMALGAVLVAAFLQLVPERGTPMTALGRATLPVYAWHGLAIYAIRYMELAALLGGSLPRTLLTTAALVCVLGFGPIAEATTALISTRRAGRDSTARESTPPADVARFVPLWIGVALLGKAWLARWLAVGDTSLLPALMMEGPFLALLLALAWPLQRRPRIALLVAADAVVSLLLLATAVYAGYFNQLLTPLAFQAAGQTGEVADSINELLKPAHLLYLADFPFILWAVLKGVPGPPAVRRRWPKAALPVAAAALGACTLLVVRAWALPADVNPLAAAETRGLLAVQAAGLRPQEASANTDVEGVLAKLRELRPAGGERIADFPRGAAKGKNLILIQVESAQAILVGAEMQGQRPWPNITDLAAQSWYFPWTFAQISGGNTSDAEFVTNTSMYPPRDQAASMRWSDRVLPSLPRLLRERGYETMTFHANTANFWNRKNLYPALGFDRYYDRSKLGWSPRDWKWGSSDEVVFRKGLAEMKRVREEGKRFYAQFVTMSTHQPFTRPPAAYRPMKLRGPAASTLAGRYLQSESYVDGAVGKLIAGLKSEGLWDESIVVVYGDHFGLRKPEDAAEAESYRQLYGHPYTAADMLNVPLIVHMPGQTRGYVVDHAVGQADILPTLADALGIDLGDMPVFGRDAFEASEPLIGQRGGGAPNGSTINDHVLFMPGVGASDGEAIDFRTGQAVPVDRQTRDDHERALLLMELSAAYTEGLPLREDYEEGNIIIPDTSEPAAPSAEASEAE